MKKSISTDLEAMDITPGRKERLGENFDSILDLAAAPIEQVLSADPDISFSDAHELQGQARTRAVVMSRLFREQRLSSSIRVAVRAESGIKDMMPVPSYGQMFDTNWADQCPPGAIEATTSPVAYLADLYREAARIEKSSVENHKIPLAARRPDLPGLMLDHTTLNRVEPTIVLVNEVLENSVLNYLGGIGQGKKLVDDVLLEARYPMVLPYERYQQQIAHVLGQKSLLPGSAIRCADKNYPYFKEPGVHSSRSDDALQQDTGLGPEQQSLLLEAPYFPNLASGAREGEDEDKPLRINPRSRMIEPRSGDRLGFFKLHFGEDNFNALYDTKTFCRRTGLSSDELDSLLSIGQYAPNKSVNGIPQAGLIDGATFGSVYINGGKSPCIGIEAVTETDTAANVVVLSHNLSNCSFDRFDRINRMVRLARWLNLPFDQADRLLCAAIAAESRPQADAWYIRSDTLRALGLFQSMRASYQISADDFATLLGGLSLCSRGKEPSQFDQVFNRQALFPAPLILDDTEFDIAPATEARRRRLDHMCVALGMSHETYRFCASVIQQAQGGATLYWSNQVVSAFYRLSLLSRVLKVSTIELIAMLELMGNGASQQVAKLAGIPVLATYKEPGNNDTVSTLQALVDFHQWVIERKWDVGVLCRLGLPAVTKLIATDTEYNLLQHISQQLHAALITPSSFSEIGADAASDGKVPIDWFKALASFIDSSPVSGVGSSKGLVKYLYPETDSSFEVALSETIKRLLEEHGRADQALQAKLVNMIMRARGIQEALLMEGLGTYLSVSADAAKQLLAWVGANRYQVLKEVLRVAPAIGNPSAQPLAIDDEVLRILDALSKRALLTVHLGLSPVLVALFIREPKWFGLPDSELSFPCVYTLSQYAQILRLSEQGEDQLLDYFRLINTFWPSQDIPPGHEGYAAQAVNRKLIRDSAACKLAICLNWGVGEVLKVAAHINPEHGVIFTLQELDLLVRVRLFGQQVALDAQAVLALGNLSPVSRLETYRNAAELALTSINESLLGRSTGEVSQSHKSVITVSEEPLVANKPDSYATVSLTLRDLMDDPLEGIVITWSTDLGKLRETVSVTDSQGRTSIDLYSTKVMGIAQVKATYGLEELLLAPGIVISCEDASLHTSEASRSPSQGHSNKQDIIEYNIVLMDAWGNLGTDRNVEWGTDLGEFQRYMGRSDRDGRATALLRSSTHGYASVVVRLDNGHTTEFDPVEFISSPYFEYVKFARPLFAGIYTELHCKLVHLNGDPISNETVTWEVSQGAITPGYSTTDNNGVASTSFLSGEDGVVVVKARAGVGGASAELTIEGTEIHPAPDIIDGRQTSHEYVLNEHAPVEFEVVLSYGSVYAEGAPVDWLVGDHYVTTTVCDHRGVARFSRAFDSEGVKHIKAAIANTPKNHSFTVNVVEHYVVETSVTGWLDEQIPDLLSHGNTYTFNIKVLLGGRVVENVPFKVASVGASLELLRITVPDLDKPLMSSLDGVDLNIQLSPVRTEAQNQPADITFDVDLGRNAVRRNFKVGFIWRPETLTFMNSVFLGVKYVHAPGESMPSAINLGVFTGQLTSLINMQTQLSTDNLIVRRISYAGADDPRWIIRGEAWVSPKPSVGEMFRITSGGSWSKYSVYQEGLLRVTS